MEHVPECDISASIKELCRIAEHWVAFTVANFSDTYCVNGEMVECHITRHPGEWWLEKTREAVGSTWNIEMRDDGPNRWLFLLERKK